MGRAAPTSAAPAGGGGAAVLDHDCAGTLIGQPLPKDAGAAGIGLGDKGEQPQIIGQEQRIVPRTTGRSGSAVIPCGGGTGGSVAAAIRLVSRPRTISASVRYAFQPPAGPARRRRPRPRRIARSQGGQVSSNARLDPLGRGPNRAETVIGIDRQHGLLRRAPLQQGSSPAMWVCLNMSSSINAGTKEQEDHHHLPSAGSNRFRVQRRSLAHFSPIRAPRGTGNIDPRRPGAGPVTSGPGAGGRFRGQAGAIQDPAISTDEAPRHVTASSHCHAPVRRAGPCPGDRGQQRRPVAVPLRDGEEKRHIPVERRTGSRSRPIWGFGDRFRGWAATTDTRFGIDVSRPRSAPMAGPVKPARSRPRHVRRPPS